MEHEFLVRMACTFNFGTVENIYGDSVSSRNGSDVAQC